jgi:hypothetical protein
MTMQTDVMAGSIAATGSVYGTRTRVRGLLVNPTASAGSIVLKDGGASGTTIMTIPTAANGEPFSVIIPANGVVFETDVYATVSNATAVVFYG